MRVLQYFCNLCKEKKEISEIYTLYFKSDILPQRYVLLKQMPDKSDKHICIHCVSLIKQS